MRLNHLFAASALCLVAVSPAIAATDTITASATTQTAMTVSCTDLSFGTLGVDPDNAETTITVDASSGTVSSGSPTDVYVASGTGGRAICTVTGEVGDNATAALSASNATYSAPTLSGLDFTDASTVLTDAGSATLSAVDSISSGATAFYIGGTLTIPADFDAANAHGTYTSQDITVTVTD